MSEEQYLLHAACNFQCCHIFKYGYLLIIFQSQLAQTKAKFKWIDWGLNM